MSLVIAGLVATAPVVERPNVLFILVDDLGWTDLGYSGSTFYDTPNIDRLASSGMVFTQAYAACPVCSPTRASIMAGKYPARMDTTDWFGARQPEELGENYKRPLKPAHYLNRLPLEEVTLAEAFKEGGYRTFFAGKWHLGPQGFWPEDQGFDVNVGGNQTGGPYGPGKYFHPFDKPNLESKPGDHLPARLAEETVKFIESGEGPFFAYLSFYSVHTPLVGRPDLVERYRGLKSDLRATEEDIWGEEGPRKVRLVQEHAVYAAMVAAMDEAVGHVLDYLDENGLRDSTVVVFFSDNGGLSTSEGHPTSNLPLRAGKGWLYEGGIREPMIVRAPGVTRAVTMSRSPVVSTDFYPTLLELCGLPSRPEQHVDGRSFVDLLKRGELPERPIFWHYPHYGNQGGSPGSAVRLGDWKLIEWFEQGRSLELYNLSDDIGETENLISAESERAKEMLVMLREWRRSVDAKMPTPN